MVYFDNAATTRFKPISVTTAVVKHVVKSANPGRSSHDESINAFLAIDDCREEIARRFFAGRTIFTKNCTEALNLAINGSGLKNRVVTTVMEHNSVLRPLYKLSKLGMIELVIVQPKDGDIIAPVLNAVNKNTSAVIVSAMSNVTGHIIDIDELSNKIKSQSDALFICDMAQAAGHVQYKFDCVDMAAFAGHKSLHGIQGTGFLLVKDHIRLEPLIMGGTGSSTTSLESPKSIPDGMEAGTLNTPGIVALCRGIKWTYRYFDRLNRRIEKVFLHMKEVFERIDNLLLIAAENGIITANIMGMDSSDFAAKLNDNGIAVRSGLHCAPLAHKYLMTEKSGAVRFSIGYNNDLSDAERAIEVVEGICHAAKSSRV